MRVAEAETIASRETVPASRTGLKLAFGSAACLVLAGGLLWWRQGGEVFERLVTTALAWCL